MFARVDVLYQIENLDASSYQSNLIHRNVRAFRKFQVIRGHFTSTRKPFAKWV